MDTLSGIVRRIDDLGRIVIPKEMRRKVKIEEGDQVEITLRNDGKIEINKYLPLGDKFDVMEKLATSLSKSIGYKVLITDKEKVIVDTTKTKEMVNENITAASGITKPNKNDIPASIRNNQGSLLVIVVAVISSISTLNSVLDVPIKLTSVLL